MAGLVRFVLEDPNYDPDEHDERLLIAHFPKGSRLAQAVTDMWQREGLEIYELPSEPVVKKAHKPTRQAQ